jgi:hypothetical protein
MGNAGPLAPQKKTSDRNANNIRGDCPQGSPLPHRLTPPQTACSSSPQAAWQRLGIRLRQEELNLVLRGQRRHFHRISEPVGLFK